MLAKILHIDDSVIVCIKAPGMDSEKDVPRSLAEQCRTEEVFCVHRLDKAVGGVMVYARTKQAASALSAQISTRTVEKRYLAVVHGCPAEEAGEFKDLLFRDANKNKSYVVKRMRQGVKDASLEYRLAEKAESCSLVSILLHTGRSHQIRVQFSSRGMPLLGDIKYGSTERGCTIALWALSLVFSHPVSGKKMEFSALPEADQFPWNKFDFMKEGLVHGQNI